MEDISTSFQGSLTHPRSPRRLGRALADAGLLPAIQLYLALAEHKRLGVPLGRVLTAQGHVSEAQLYAALAHQWGWQRADLLHEPPESELVRKVGLAKCQAFGVTPWKSQMNRVLLACDDPKSFETVRRDFERKLGPVTPVAAPRSEILDALAKAEPEAAAHNASHFLPEHHSCRALAYNQKRYQLFFAFLAVAVLALLTLAPAQAILAMTVGAVFLSIGSALLKWVAFLAHFLAKPPQTSTPHRYPPISVIVPMFHEPDIALALVKRLTRIDYPSPLLQILLVVEEFDQDTQTMLACHSLPPWFRIVIVPDGQPRTKPRALNHAMHYCTGDIIGIYDAEDAPGPEQLHQVVATFADAPPDVACVQGVLEFYNPRTNWLARCFSLDYAAWFRVILPGWARLGLPVPLGGTTLFLRREAILALRGWDAHNVTEDADLGLRLARAGYKTRLIPSVTGEEANCHTWLWIRQRSRWIKGYMVTYWAHMRHPLRCAKDLGVWPFLGFQLLFLGTILHFAVAPLLWSFWLAVFGLPHPFFDLLPAGVGQTAAIAFVAAEVSGMIILATAAIRAKRLFLLPWIPTMSLYFLLAVPAGVKALWEFVWSPVYWDKTDHGHSLRKPNQDASRSASDLSRVTKAFEI